MILKRAYIYLLIVSLSAFVLSCSKTVKLEGTWKVDDGFHVAVYEITSHADYYKGEVLYYNDGTTIYSKKDESHYAFEHLTLDGKHYVELDGITGATKTEKPNPKFTITPLNDSTLESKTYFNEDALTHIWRRTN